MIQSAFSVVDEEGSSAACRHLLAVTLYLVNGDPLPG